MSTSFFPSLSKIIPLEKIPTELGFLQGGINQVFSHLYYRDLQQHNTNSGDGHFYNLGIVTYRKLGIEIPGTDGMALVLNPGFVSGNTSEFPIAVGYQWKIQKYLKGFDLSQFDFSSGKSYYEVLKKISAASENHLLYQSVSTIIPGVDPIQSFVDDYNSSFIPNPLLSRSNDPDINVVIDDLVNQIKLLRNSSSALPDVFDSVYSLYLSTAQDLDTAKSIIQLLFNNLLPSFALKDIEDFLVPQAFAAINQLSLALEFPRKYLKPIDPQTGEVIDENSPLPEEDRQKSVLSFDIGAIKYSTGIGLEFESIGSFSLSPSQIGNTGFTVEAIGIELDLSKTKNIPAAAADGRPDDFVGVFIQEATIGLPTFWKKDTQNSQGEIKGRNLLIGTGGISGTIELDTTNGPLFKTNLGSNSGFEIDLDSFDITFQQNSIVDSDIRGRLKIPGFTDNNNQPAIINVDAHIGTGGEFQVTASVTQTITALRLPNVFDLNISSLFVGRNDVGKFYIGASGTIDFMQQGSLGKFLPSDIEIKGFYIYEDGTFELQGGGIVFPKAYTFHLGPATISITGIHMGSHEQEKGGVLRKYRYFGFDGGVSVNPGGVDARGKGVKFYFTVDNLNPYDFFIRIQSLAVDIILPSGANEKDATTVIKGFLAMKDPTPPQPDDSVEYAGSVSFKIPLLKGLEGAAAMRFNPSVPDFILDIDLELSAPIVLGASGLGIYGFRALFGRKYVASKLAVNGLTEDSEWWQYYKAKIDPSFKEGIQVEKFLPEDGLSLGAGVSLATATDSGKTFSTKLFLLLSMPDVFLFQGQAQLLKKRIGLDTNPDPPFFAIIAITHQSVEAAFGIDYKINDDSDPGKMVTVDGVTEMGFFFGNSTAWYVNIGRDTPAERRIQARVFDIFNMYFYLMMSSNGIKAGAGASFALTKKFGPLRAELSAFLDTAGKISFHPKQIGGSINLGGNVGLYIFKFGFSISVNAGLAGESSMPRIVTGTFEVCIKVLKKQYCAHFDLTWNFNNNLNFTPVDLIEPATIQEAGKTSNILNGETLNVYGIAIPGSITNSQIPIPSNWAGGADSYIVPLDSYIDLEFKKGMDVSDPALAKFGGVSTGSSFVEYVAPQRAKSDQVRHEYKANKIEILYFDSNNPASGNWQTYDFYQALTPQQLASFVNQTTLQNLKYGYWQIDQPGKYNKLRVLAQDPLSFIKSGTLPEDFGVTDQTIFCGETPRAKTCIDFTDKSALPSIIPKDELLFYMGIIVRLNGHDGMVIPFPYLTYPNALSLLDNDFVEVFFNQPSACVQFLAQTFAPNITVSYYKRDTQNPADIHSLPTYSYTLIRTDVIQAADLATAVVYMDAQNCVDKMVITAGVCPPPAPGTNPLYCTANGTIYLGYLQKFIGLMIKLKQLTLNPLFIYPNNDNFYNGVFENTPLYNKPLNKADQIIKTVDVNTPTQLQFTITDNTGYSCTFNMVLQGTAPGFDWNNLESISNVRPNSNGQVAGTNYDFLADVSYFGAGGIFTATILVTTCYPSNICSSDCSTLLYSFCFQNLEDFLYNQTIPSSSQVQQNAQQMVDALTQTLQPVWRPNTHFAIKAEVVDTMYQQASGTPTASSLNTFLFCFKTAGPVGHYHEFPTTADTEIPRTDFAALQAIDHEAEFQLSTLNLYVDYPKCYPNADGDLINAKPLFYKNPKLLMFYNKPYVYQFYNDWNAYGNTEAINSSLDVIIKDPAEPVLTNNQTTVAPSGITAWVTTQNSLDHDSQIIPNDVNALSNMLQNGNPCIPPITSPLTPIQMGNEITFQNDLLPLKLYTAIYNARYKRAVTDTKTFIREVYRYVFQTSRYGDFTEQVNSYILKSHIDTNTSQLVIDKSAVFDIAQAFDNATQIAIASQFVTDPNTVSDSLIQQFSHPYDRLIDGILKIRSTNSPNQSLEPAVTNEFNFIKDTNTGNIIGVLVRCPEPFNDPKIPSAVLQTTLSLTVTIGNLNIPSFSVFFSKDNAEAFITNDDASLNMPPNGNYAFTFTYKQFDGNQYGTVGSPITVVITR